MISWQNEKRIYCNSVTKEKENSLMIMKVRSITSFPLSTMVKALYEKRIYCNSVTKQKRKQLDDKESEKH